MLARKNPRSHEAKGGEEASLFFWHFSWHLPELLAAFNRSVQFPSSPGRAAGEQPAPAAPPATPAEFRASPTQPQVTRRRGASLRSLSITDFAEGSGLFPQPEAAHGRRHRLAEHGKLITPGGGGGEARPGEAVGEFSVFFPPTAANFGSRKHPKSTEEPVSSREENKPSSACVRTAAPCPETGLLQHFGGGMCNPPKK